MAAPSSSAGDRVLATFSLASSPGNERIAMTRVAEAVAALGLTPARLEQLKTAVAEATMNAIEHGNHNRPELPVDVEVTRNPDALRIRIRDHGGGAAIAEAQTPDLDAKLAGLQTPRGWGLFLIRSMVDDVTLDSDEASSTVTLTVRLDGPAATAEVAT